MSEYFVGIDLGTTHSALYYAEKDTNASLKQLHIPQLTAPGRMEEKTLLPSFVYFPHQTELLESDRLLPWGQSEHIVGALARELGAKSQGRMIQSAKSWLCHSRVSVDEKVLPVDALEEVEKVSPAQVTEWLIEHLVNAWNHAFPENALEHQHLVITVPASFDPAARATTEAAAQKLGLKARLIEEPLAAFYAWLSEQADWTTSLEVGDHILVVDVGGGTTDLSLIQASDNDGALALERVSVGRHILLGGDNMDMTLTYHVAGQLAQQGTQLEPWQISGLTQACREAKERLLANTELTEATVTVPSRGRSLFNNAIKATLTQQDIQTLILAGFFPEVQQGERAQSQPRSGFAAINLDYESDPAITRHISEFLANSDALPTKVLFNGGVFNADPIRKLLAERLDALCGQGQTLEMLTPSHLDHAVAKGAAYYELTQYEGGVKVKSGLAANYYIGVASPMPAIPGMAPPVDAVCVAPFGLEEGSEEVMLPNEFSLVVGEQVIFRFFQSNNADVDSVGKVIASFSVPTLTELPPLSVYLDAKQYSAGEMVRVCVSAHVNELGLLMLQAHDVNSDHVWQIEFQTRES
ncbi:Hsp70 family protein [Marinomonas mediterranea]|jgi:Molecular chaperone|uniref:Heat shock protein 70 n=1 Tax=Marinomonas mediterranea (strain ATCC 700492 / JCM 21426 / NBRC 103028 / MMB-1) TaxID=717774 RepID=F2K3Z4_MARM1|nr:Hsp70 family protein [Marinomonas mediterranea]ADZ91336.1 heat shock protein 70 [Marinomonas mediterranea MMB-1]WCN13388.1 Hsp70 family protein [Marinomonas mediterranea]WCN17456.1 Hsp70 family protein [Marinomonas mediterranea MMB-1]